MEEASKIGRSVSAKETAAMRACVSSLGEIKAALIPFLRVLNEDNEDDESSLSPHKRAEAQAAVALVSILDYACLSSADAHNRIRNDSVFGYTEAHGTPSSGAKAR